MSIFFSSPVQLNEFTSIGTSLYHFGSSTSNEEKPFQVAIDYFTARRSFELRKDFDQCLENLKISDDILLNPTLKERLERSIHKLIHKKIVSETRESIEVLSKESRKFQYLPKTLNLAGRYIELLQNAAHAQVSRSLCQVELSKFFLELVLYHEGEEETIITLIETFLQRIDTEGIEDSLKSYLLYRFHGYLVENTNCINANTYTIQTLLSSWVCKYNSAEEQNSQLLKYFIKKTRYQTNLLKIKGLVKETFILLSSFYPFSYKDLLSIDKATHAKLLLLEKLPVTDEESMQFAHERIAEKFSLTKEAIESDIDLFRLLEEYRGFFDFKDIQEVKSILERCFSQPLIEEFTRTKNATYDYLGREYIVRLQRQLFNHIFLGRSEPIRLGEFRNAVHNFLLQLQEVLPLTRRAFIFSLSDEQVDNVFMRSGICTGMIAQHLSLYQESVETSYLEKIKKQGISLSKKEDVPGMGEVYFFEDYSAEVLASARFFQGWHTLNSSFYYSKTKSLHNYLKNSGLEGVGGYRQIKSLQESLPDEVPLKRLDYLFPKKIQEQSGIKFSPKEEFVDVHPSVLVSKIEQLEDREGAVLLLEGRETQHTVFLSFKENYLLDPNGLVLVFNDKTALKKYITFVLQVVSSQYYSVTFYSFDKGSS
jgi:hypothetical protein